MRRVFATGDAATAATSGRRFNRSIAFGGESPFRAAPVRSLNCL